MWWEIEGHKIGRGLPIFIVAEVSGNHRQQEKLAHELVAQAKQAGADAVKFQCFEPEEMVALGRTGPAPAGTPWESMTYEDVYAQTYTPKEWFPDLFAQARDLGMVPFSSCFGRTSMEFLESVECEAFKIAAPEATNLELYWLLRDTGKTLIVSNGGGIKDIRLYCPPGYPVAEFAIPKLRWRNGLSCHSTDPAIMAVAAAQETCFLMEYHIRGEEDGAMDDLFSLKPREFADTVELVRRVEAWR